MDKRTKKVLFFASGGGGNLRFIHQVSTSGLIKKLAGLDVEVLGCLADRDCGALEYCQENKLYGSKHSFKRTEQENSNLLGALTELKPDIVITNVHRILSPEILTKNGVVFLNLHYSILPAFAGLIGMETITKAQELGCRFVGTTCHVVEKEVDAGHIISQSTTTVLETKEIAQEVFESGCINLLNGILDVCGVDLETSSTRQSSIFSPSIELSVLNSEMNRIFKTIKS